MIGIKALAVVLALTLLVVSAPAHAASGEPGVRFTRLIIEPDGPDFNITVHYSASLMTKIFSLLFGARVVQPVIVDELAGLNATVVSVDTANGVAKLVARNQARLNNGWYVYDRGAKLPVPVDRVEIRGKTVDWPMMLAHAVEVPTFFYRPEEREATKKRE